MILHCLGAPCEGCKKWVEPDMELSQLAHGFFMDYSYLNHELDDRQEMTKRHSVARDSGLNHVLVKVQIIQSSPPTLGM